jgi:hypothetical protein
VRAALPVDYQKLQDVWAGWKPSGDGSLELQKPYVLTGDDRRFLRSLRIVQDEDPPTEN